MPKLNDLVDRLRPISTREDAIALLEEIPDPEAEKFEELITRIQTASFFIRKFLPEGVKQMRKHLPHPPGGRPKALTIEESRHACAQVGTLLGRGMGLPEALKDVAKKHGVSLRTMQRVWRKRREYWAST